MILKVIQYLSYCHASNIKLIQNVRVSSIYNSPALVEIRSHHGSIYLTCFQKVHYHAALQFKAKGMGYQRLPFRLFQNNPFLAANFFMDDSRLSINREASLISLLSVRRSVQSTFFTPPIQAKWSRSEHRRGHSGQLLHGQPPLFPF